MDYQQVLRQRCSTRQFDTREVSNVVLDSMMNDALLAPMSGNRQADRKLILVTDKAQLKRMAHAVKNAWERFMDISSEGIAEQMRAYGDNFEHFAHAPAVIFLAARRTPDFLNAHLSQDLAEKFQGNGASVIMSAMLLQLSAEANGLGSCMLTGPLIAEDELKKELNLNSRWNLYGLVTLGYKL